MYLATQDVCAAAGMPAYEVSNHARLGSESRHNLIYWRYGDYAGVGPGAHGRITADGRRCATETIREPSKWLAAVEAGDGGGSGREALSGADQAIEYLMMAMRLAEGADAERYARLAGSRLDNARIAALVEDGLVAANGGRIAATARGRPVLNAVLRALLT